MTHLEDISTVPADSIPPNYLIFKYIVRAKNTLKDCVLIGRELYPLVLVDLALVAHLITHSRND